MTESNKPNLQLAAKEGTYYNPAYTHYVKNDKNDNTIIVSCDRCNRDNLPVCIGFGEVDLCLKCATELTEITTSNYIPNSDPVTKMQQDIFRSKTSDFPNENIKTLMAQDMFSKNKNN